MKGTVAWSTVPPGQHTDGIRDGGPQFSSKCNTTLGSAGDLPALCLLHGVCVCACVRGKRGGEEEERGEMSLL
jgi:hypothetical protein